MHKANTHHISYIQIYNRYTVYINIHYKYVRVLCIPINKLIMIENVMIVHFKQNIHAIQC